VAVRRQLGAEEHGDFGQRVVGGRQRPERRQPAAEGPEPVGVRVPPADRLVQHHRVSRAPFGRRVWPVPVLDLVDGPHHVVE